jgi:hypothetical protein
MYFCLPNINNGIYIQQLREKVPPPNQNTVAVCNHITLLILYYISQVPSAFILLLVSSSSILAFRYFFCLFLKCLLASCLTLLDYL